MDEKIDVLLKTAIKNKASDLHITVGNKPNLRINGKLIAINTASLKAADTEAMILSTMTDDIRKAFERNLEVDYLYVLANGERFRVNAYKSQGSYEAVFRSIKNNISTLHDLGISDRVKDIISYPNGLSLIVGATSSGKSTTLASLINELNATKELRIITIENPIEILYTNNRSVISQREIGVDTKDFPTALRSALRQDPDVIVLGEIRDRETATIALEAAQTGHLVLSTMHAADTADAINRFINIFPDSERENARSMLADALRGIVGQRLIKDVNGGRVPAIEILLNSLRISEAIKGLETKPILEILHESSGQGMQTFEDSLVRLVTAKQIGLSEAKAAATEETSLVLRLKSQSSI